MLGTVFLLGDNAGPMWSGEGWSACYRALLYDEQCRRIAIIQHTKRGGVFGPCLVCTWRSRLLGSIELELSFRVTWLRDSRAGVMIRGNTNTRRCWVEHHIGWGRGGGVLFWGVHSSCNLL